MKRFRVARSTSLAAICMGLSIAHAQTGMSVFGVMDVSARQTTAEGAPSVNTLASGGIAGSRLGLRGVEDLGGGLSASFWLEADIVADTGAANATAFWSRRATIALAHKRWGEVRMGRDYVPLFSRQYVVFSPFGPNGVASNGSLFFGTASLLGSGSGAGARADNMVKYVLPPTFGGWHGEVMASAAEGRSVNRHRGAVLGYGRGPFLVNLGFGDTNDASGVDKIKLRTVGASYDKGPLKFTTLVQRAAYRQRRQTTVDLGVAVRVGAGVVKGSVIRADQEGAGTDSNDAQQVSLGYVHALSRRTSLYGTFSRIDNRGTQSFGLGGVVPGPGRDMRGMDVGINHVF